MPTYAKSIDVAVPVRTAYDQWTQFELFPRFMDGVERVTQIDDTHTHWVTSIAGVQREFDALITEQQPDERVAWRSTNGPEQAGVVTFHRLDDATTRVHLQFEHSPSGIAETAGAATGMLGHQLQADLDRFKEFIESQPMSTGGWRGSVAPSPQHDQRPPEQ
ncbi:MAG TPA: SRPBCC family protein [Pseudonocardiaceae bacterium]|nr:SRPBCC family protein [Pseudonocardiaceae bacterium]